MADLRVSKLALDGRPTYKSALHIESQKGIPQTPGGLFATRSGESLPIEICLKIIENVLSADPKVGSWVLKTLSKSFNRLLHSYEHSIVRTVSKNEETINLYPNILIPSWPRHSRIAGPTYPWLCEVRCRIHTIESLIKHEVTRMTPCPDGEMVIDLPFPDVPEPESSLRLERFKKDAIQLLYNMADNTAACSSGNIHEIRASQRVYFESLSTTQLALMGVITRVLGLGYYRLTKCKNPTKANDTIRDRWIVFEDRLLRYGPFFAWATSVQTTGRIHEWSNEVMTDAVEAMEAFETGRVQGYASLQSMLWKLFCTRQKCDMFDSWELAREIVEDEMMNYEV